MEEKFSKNKKPTPHMVIRKSSETKKKQGDDFWDQFSENERAVIDFIDRVIVNKEFGE